MDYLTVGSPADHPQVDGSPPDGRTGPFHLHAEDGGTPGQPLWIARYPVQRRNAMLRLFGLQNNPFISGILGVLGLVIGIGTHRPLITVIGVVLLLLGAFRLVTRRQQRR